MRHCDFKVVLSDTYERLQELTNSKGAEYTGQDRGLDDQLANFREGALRVGITMEQVWLVLFDKHVSAINAFVRTGKERSEPITGRIDDAILYLVLLKAIVQERRLGDEDE